MNPVYALRQNPEQDLRRLIVVIGTAIAGFGLALIAIIAFAGISANQSAVERDKNLVDNAINQNIARVLSEQKSVAFWDDAVQKIALAWDEDWIKKEFGTYLTETYGHDQIFILNGSDAPVFIMEEGAVIPLDGHNEILSAISPLVNEVRTGKQGGLTEHVDLFGPSQDRFEVFSGVLTCSRYRGHILAVGGRPAVVTGITICPTVDVTLNAGATPHMLVSVAYIDQGFMEDMGRSLLLPDLRLAELPATGRGSIATPFITDNGERTGELVWTPKHPGDVLLTLVLPLVICGVIATGILSFAMFRRLRAASAALGQREALARFEARHDGLSSLPNRHYFNERIQQALGSYGPGQRIAVAYIDVDRFKDTNDTLGHQAGDELIKSVGSRLQQSLGPGDFLSRFGGDEFAVIHLDGQKSDLNVWVNTLLSSFSEPFDVFGQAIKVTGSIGIATSPDHGRTSIELMRKADIALYAAKDMGRDQAILFTAEMAENIEQRLQIELDLRDAILRDELSLHYQPVVSCRDGQITGVEALLRWASPKHGSLSPALFVPIAEAAGLMPHLGSWILERAFVESHLWPKLEVSVNLSPAQFMHVDLASLLRHLIQKTRVRPEKIVLEITEGVLLESSPRTLKTIQDIRSMGFKIALDDFGTGYSSLSYLQNFQFDKLKIDRSFVRDLTLRNEAKLIVQAVVNLGRGLGMEVVAEGVETEVEAAVMRMFGCTSMQGFLFSQAVPADDVAAIVAGFMTNKRKIDGPSGKLATHHG